MAIEQIGRQWYFRFQFKGREYRRPTGLDASASNLRKAEAVEAEFKFLLKAGKAPGLVRRVPFEEAAEDFLKWCNSTEYRGRGSTARRIATSFASLRGFFGSLAVCDIDQNAVEGYKSWRSEEHQVRACTLRNDLQNLSIFFRRYALRKKYAEVNPTIEVSKPSTVDAVRIHVLSDKEEHAYFDAALAESKNLYDLGRIMLLQGPRPEEVLAFRKEHFDPKKRTQFIPGGKTPAARRVLDLTDEAFEILLWRSKHQPASPWMFPSPLTWRKGEHLTKLNHPHDAACLAAGVAFVLYDLRHTFGTRMAVDVGVPLPALAAIMGHSTLSQVLKYVHPSKEAKAAAMSKYQTWLTARSEKTRKAKRANPA